MTMESKPDPEPMTAEHKLTSIYQWIEGRLTVLDDMTAPQYNRLDPMTELRAVLHAIDSLDEA